MREFSAASEKCPGEEECSAFKKTKGTHAEREKEACTGGNAEKPVCPMFKTKNRRFEMSEQLRTVERFVKEKQAGFSPSADELTINEYEAVLYWLDLERQYDLSYQNALLSSLGVFSAFVK